MKFFYISKSTFFLYFLIFCFFAILSNIYFLIFWILIFGTTLYLFRKKKINNREDQVTTKGTLYAPVSGSVLDIWKDDTGRTNVTLLTNLFDHYGLYMPTSGSILDLSFREDTYIYRAFSRDSFKDKYNAEIIIGDNLNNEIKLRFLRFFTSRKPELVILPGDKGMRMANMGYVPFGGMTSVVIPENYEVVVSKNDNVYATDSIIARIAS